MHLARVALMTACILYGYSCESYKVAPAMVESAQLSPSP